MLWYSLDAIVIKYFLSQGRTIMKVDLCRTEKINSKKNELLMKWKVEAYIWMRRGSIPKGNKSVQTILES